MDKKFCTGCGETKTLDQFYPHAGQASGRQPRCAVCCKSHNKRRKLERRLKIIEQFGDICYDCGEIYHPAMYEFHHVEKKSFNIASNLTLSWNKLNKELKKCVMLCANCHRLRHYKERMYR